MIFVMGLLASAAVPDDRILRTNGASPKDDFAARLGPINPEVVQPRRKWDKENRGMRALAGRSPCQELRPNWGLRLLTKSPTGKRITLSIAPGA
jgi:hypothetical protein